MNTNHEANRRHWNKASPWWESLRDKDGIWERCVEEPTHCFAGKAFDLIRELAGNLEGRNTCVVGSGDNYAALALSGLKARVTSIDISTAQLEVASRRAQYLRLPIKFVQSDAADLSVIQDSEFDLACSTNGFFVWISDLQAVFNEIFRVLRPGGLYVFYDVHPFQRPWKNVVDHIEAKKSYWDVGPFEDSEEGTFEFERTIGELLNLLVESGFVLRRVLETPADDSRFWQDYSYLPGTDDELLDWRRNPRAALPVWLTMAVQKPLHR